MNDSSRGLGPQHLLLATDLCARCDRPLDRAKQLALEWQSELVILTVREGQPLSHANQGWEKFTDDVIQKINDDQEGVIFVLWGSPAQAKASRVNAQKHVILKAPHPSPLSAYRGFFGSKPFSTINGILEKQGKTPIKWA